MRNIEIQPDLTGDVAEGRSLECEHREIKVMIVDDSRTIRRTAETLLKKEGYRVISATDGFEALSVIAENKPDLIFLDVMMPRLDGYQTCALLKHHQVFRHTPVVMLSSKDGLFDRARGRVVGSDNYMTKPFTRDELLTVIAQYFSSHGFKGGQAHSRVMNIT
jgi:twitching motility two-component system response regulator PilG